MLNTGWVGDSEATQAGACVCSMSWATIAPLGSSSKMGLASDRLPSRGRGPTRAQPQKKRLGGGAFTVARRQPQRTVPPDRSAPEQWLMAGLRSNLGAVSAMRNGSSQGEAWRYGGRSRREAFHSAPRPITPGQGRLGLGKSGEDGPARRPGSPTLSVES